MALCVQLGPASSVLLRCAMAGFVVVVVADIATLLLFGVFLFCMERLTWIGPGGTIAKAA